MLLSELCDILEVPRSDPTAPDPGKNLHVFDRAINRENPDGTSVTNDIDVYRTSHRVLPTLQSVSEIGGDHQVPPMNGSGEEDSRRPVIAATPLAPTRANHLRRHGSKLFPKNMTLATPAWPDSLPDHVAILRKHSPSLTTRASQLPTPKTTQTVSAERMKTHRDDRKRLKS